MSEPAPRQALQQRVATAILDGATQIFAIQGEQASMNDVAEAAGVARATVYRYFPNRDALLNELANTAANDVNARLTAARINEVTPEEGITRAVRALVDIGDSFVLLTRQRQRTNPEQFKRNITQPIGQLFQRGQANADLRHDITTDRLTEALTGLIIGMLTSTPKLGQEDMTATITSLFLNGARARGPQPL